MWVRISLAISGLVIFIALFPTLMREIRLDSAPRPLPPPSLEGLSPEQIAQFQQAMVEREYRLWVGVFRTILVGALLGLAAGLLLSRWLVAPLQNLERGAKAISEGQLDYRVPLRGSREIQSVAMAFNQMAEELKDAETLRRNLLADVTHELRHPLHIVRGNLQAILDGVYPLEMAEIASLFGQTQHLTALVNDLHELAQAEARQLPLYRQETDLTVLAANVIEAFQPVAAAKEIDLRFASPFQPVFRSVDPDRIRQALQNLLNNALRYTSAGGCITATLLDQDGQLEIQVQDTGIGIPPQDLSRVFDRFYSADPSRNRQDGGSGLGLAIARAIMQAHDGEIDAYSAGVGQGSTFTIRL
jgi:signal transduction histidine kinase